MKRIAVIAAVLAVAACKGKMERSLDTIPKPMAAPAAAPAMDSGMKMDSAMKMADTTKKMAAPMKAAPPPAKKP
jgi:hypothetical protein